MRLKLIGFILMIVLLVAACSGGSAEQDTNTGTNSDADTAATTSDDTAETEPETSDNMEEGLTGQVLVDGSSTVAPITSAVAEEFAKVAPGVRVPVGISGTGGGFEKFCNGETDISDASRPIKESETALCAENGVEYIELPVAFDGLAVLVNPQNDWAACLTVDELRMIWEPAAEGEITNWNQVRSDFPDAPLNLYGAGTDSGTYDYFTEAINGEEGASRGDFLPSEDDNVLVQGIAGDMNAIGFFGLAYYEQNRDKLKLVGVDDGDGCVEPNTETVSGGTYQPLSRPIFIYVSTASAGRPEVDAFIDFYLQNAGELSAEVGYISLGNEIYSLAQQRYDNRVTGSIFEGLGSTVGVSLQDLLDNE